MTDLFPTALSCDPSQLHCGLSGLVHRLVIDGEEQALISAEDRGLHYGDGLFETILIRDAMPCLWDRHLGRLRFGAQRLGLPLPESATLQREAARAIAGLSQGVLKLILTRGTGGRGYRPPSTPVPRRLLLSYPSPSDDDQTDAGGVRVRYCDTPVSMNPALAGIKHLNRLDSVLARREWDDPLIAEGLMCYEGGDPVCGTMSNLFVWDGRRLVTPSVARGGIAGTVRAVAIEEAARAGIACAVRPVTRREIERAVGLFLTNARIGVWPVTQLGDRLFDPDSLPTPLISAIRRAAHTPGWPTP